MLEEDSEPIRNRQPTILPWLARPFFQQKKILFLMFIQVFTLSCSEKRMSLRKRKHLLMLKVISRNSAGRGMWALPQDFRLPGLNSFLYRVEKILSRLKMNMRLRE